MSHFLNPKKRCYYNLAFAFDEVPNKLVPFDYDALANYPGQVVAVVTNIRTGKAEYFEIPKYERLWETTIASCSLPVLFPPVKLGNQEYLDGGIADPIPYKKALAEGCDKVVVILTRERGYVKQQEKATNLINRAYRKYPKIVERMNARTDDYNRLLAELMQEEKAGNVFVIAPRETYGVGRTEGDWSKLQPLYQEGIEVAGEQMDALKRYLNS
jgi:predicted patatin/cPLA2 family phospholipase